MSGEIAAVAKTWLTEPRYIASFKLTSDVFKVRNGTIFLESYTVIQTIILRIISAT